MPFARAIPYRVSPFLTVYVLVPPELPLPEEALDEFPPPLLELFALPDDLDTEGALPPLYIEMFYPTRKLVPFRLFHF